MAKTKFGYGIIDKDGKPYWSEDCVCEDKSTLEMEIVCNLNDMDSVSDPDIYARRPFRVVTLWRVTR